METEEKKNGILNNILDFIGIACFAGMTAMFAGHINTGLFARDVIRYGVEYAGKHLGIYGGLTGLFGFVMGAILVILIMIPEIGKKKDDKVHMINMNLPIMIPTNNDKSKKKR